MSNDSTESIRAALRALPQAPYICPEDAQRWINYVSANERDNLAWLIERLGAGFGGSEIGTLVLDAMGRTPLFQSYAELANGKLMRVLPSPTTAPMKKGILLEQAVQLATLKLYGGEVDESVLAAFKTPSSKVPAYLAGNPDFPWVRPHNGSTIRTLVDIKVPNAGTESADSFSKALHYSCQLNQYNHINDLRGLEPFDQLMNIHLELPPVVTDAMLERLQREGELALPAIVDEMVSLLKYEQPGMRLHMIEQDINPTVEIEGRAVAMVDLIHELAEPAWHAITHGQVPAPRKRADKALDEDQKQTLSTLEAELVFRRGVHETNQQRIEQLSSEVKQLCASVSETGLVSQSEHIIIKQKAVLDEPVASELLTRYGHSLDPLRSERKKLGVRDYDTLALASHFEALVAQAQESLEADPAEREVFLKRLAETRVDRYVRDAPLDPAKVIDALHSAGESPARVLRYETAITASRKKATNELLSHMRETFESPLNDLVDAQMTAPAPHDADPSPDPQHEASVVTPTPTH